MTIIGRLWRSIENPRVPLRDFDPADAAEYGLGEGSGGLNLGRDGALTLSAVWRGVYLIANCVGMLPLYVYLRDEDGEGKHYATDHPAYSLLRHEPNSEMDAFVFRRDLMAQAILEGNAYAYIVRAGNGDPLELIPLPVNTVHPARVNGVLWYAYVPNTPGLTNKDLPQRVRWLPSGDVLHIRGPGLDGLAGTRMVSKAKESLAVGKAAQEYAGKYFANGAEPKIILEHPAKLTPEAANRLRNSWNAMHQGLDNAHKTAVLEEAMKAHVLSNDPEKSQLILTRKYTIVDVANWLGLPAQMLGAEISTSYNSLEQQNLQFLSYTMDPWLVGWESETRRKLLTEEQKRNDSHTIEFMRQAMMRADAAARGQFYHTALLDGWMNRDEVRARENLNPLPNGDGKKAFIPVNVDLTGEPRRGGSQPAEPAKPDKPVEPDDDDARQAVRAVLADAVKRMAKRLSVHAMKAGKTPESFAAWLDEGMVKDHRAVILDAIAPALNADAAVNGKDPAPGAAVDMMLNAVRSHLRNHTPDETELSAVMLTAMESSHEED